MELEEQLGFDTVYRKGGRLSQSGGFLTIETSGGLTTPDAFAQFALRSKKQYGYPAFKIHGWVNGPIDREVAAVLAIREAVGDDMDLLLDPARVFSHV